MYKLLFDSDALIKASKADLLEAVAECFDVLITEEVRNETVEEGKKRFHPDADKIENLINARKIKIINRKNYSKKKEPKESFGKGEISVFKAYKKKYIIVTDDLSFSSYINKEGIKGISSAHLLLLLFKKGKIQKDKAEHYLEKLKPYIRNDTYKLIKNDIKGE